MRSIFEQPIFIGLGGTLNAGKDSFASRLEEHGFLHVSTSDMIRAMKKKAFGDTPEALLQRNDPYINKLRTERGPGFLIDEIHAQWEANKEKYPGGYVASGMRAVGEAEAIKAQGGIIIFVDADPQVRYERSLERARDENDQKTFEEFMAAERSEIDVDPNDKSVQNLGAMREMADLIISNDGNEIPAFQDQAVEALRVFISSRE